MAVRMAVPEVVKGEHRMSSPERDRRTKMKRAPLSHRAHPILTHPSVRPDFRDGAEQGETRCRAVLAWTDTVTGDRLTVEMQGSRAFLEELKQLGFEILSEREVELETVPLSGGGSGTEERSSAGEDGDRTRTGPVPALGGADARSAGEDQGESFRVFRRRSDENDETLSA